VQQFEESLQRSRNLGPLETADIPAINTTEFSPLSSSEYSSLTEDMFLRVASNSLKLVYRMIQHDSNCLQPNSPLLLALRMQLYFILQLNGFSIKDGYRHVGSRNSYSSLQSQQFLLSSPESLLLAKDSSQNSHEISEVVDSQFHSHFELRMICDIFLIYCRKNKADMFSIFDLIPVLCTSTTLDSAFLITFFKEELPMLYTPREKRKLIIIFLALIEQQTISPSLQVKTIQVNKLFLIDDLRQHCLPVACT
jgi:hypothetical protein